MAYFSVNTHRHRAARTEGIEYRVYFALIFLFALPVAVAGWLWPVLRHGRIPAEGPVARARAEAHQIAPMIFRG